MYEHPFHKIGGIKIESETTRHLHANRDGGRYLRTRHLIKLPLPCTVRVIRARACVYGHVFQKTTKTGAGHPIDSGCLKERRGTDEVEQGPEVSCTSKVKRSVEDLVSRGTGSSSKKIGRAHV